MKRILIACSVTLALLMVCTPAMAKTTTTITEVELDVKPIDTAVSADGKSAYILTKKSILIYDINKGMIMDTIPLEKKFNSISAAPKGNKLLLTSKSLFGGKSITTISFTVTLDIPVGDSPIIGKPDAPVTLTVFTDYQCPYCSKGFPTYEKLLEKYPNDLNIVLKHFPLKFHKFAEQAAIAALAANKQGKYQEFSSIMFKNFRSLKQGEEALQKLAKEAGLDLEKLNQDRKDKSFQQQLPKDKKLGRKVGVRGVPSLFINGSKVNDRSLEGLSAMVETALKQK